MRSRALVVVISLVTLAAMGSAEAQRPGGRRPGAGFGGGAQGGSGTPQAPGSEVADAVVIDGVRYSYLPPEMLDLLERGQGRQALAAYERAAMEAEQRGAKPDALMAHGATAFLAVRFGMPQKAIRAGTRALELTKEVTPSPGVSRILGSIYSATGRAYQNAGDLAQARRVLEEGVARARAGPQGPRDPTGILLLYSLATIVFAQGEHATALARATEAFQAAEAALHALPRQAPDRVRTTLRRHASRALVLIGRVHLEERKLSEAEAALGRAKTYARLVGLTEVELETITLSAALARRRGDHAQALKLFEEGLTLARAMNRVPSLIEIHTGAAQSHAALGRADTALASAREAITLVEEVRSELQDTGLRSGFLDEKQGVYQLAVRMALQLNKVDEGFALAESSRARAFLDLLGNQTTISKGKTRALVDEEVKLRARLAEARTAAAELGDDEGDGQRARALVEAADRDYRAFLDRVRKENVEQASLMSVEPVTLAEIQKLLPEGTTLLEYLVGERDIVVWVVDRERATVRRVPADRAGLVQRVREFRTAIATQAPIAETQERAVALYRQLIEAARPEIRGTRLLVVPHDVLHYLPFAALRSPGGRWLVEDYALSTLPSASVLKFLGDKGAQASPRALAIGNPDVGAGLNLRWAEREARLVGQRVPSTTVLVRGDATEARVKSLITGAGLVHFASHGELNEADPLASALLLVPEGGEDGRLEVRELFGLELNARLVVLSACETGLGKLSRGDELVGLQRAFLYAGTPAVVTTLWKVDDRASFDLVRAFYERLAAEGPVTALRQAQLATMGAYPHPFAWAAFGLTGAPR
jgi:CHAT domain-containing protein